MSCMNMCAMNRIQCGFRWRKLHSKFASGYTAPPTRCRAHAAHLIDLEDHVLDAMLHPTVLKLVPDFNRLTGDFTANDLRKFLFPDLGTPLVGLGLFCTLVLVLYLFSRLQVGKDLFKFAETDEDVPRTVEEVEQAIDVYKNKGEADMTPREQHLVEELLREKAELLHERERGLVWLGVVTLAAFWCAGLVNTL